MDAGLLAAAQAVEHYEIARYGTLRTWAQTLGVQEAVQLLEETLNEEKKTDELLTRLAETANQAGQQGGSGEESEDESEEEGQSGGRSGRSRKR